MAKNRIVAHIEDTLIASIAEHAVQRHGGDFDAGLAEVLCAGHEAIAAADRVQAATLAAQQSAQS